MRSSSILSAYHPFCRYLWRSNGFDIAIKNSVACVRLAQTTASIKFNENNIKPPHRCDSMRVKIACLRAHSTKTSLLFYAPRFAYYWYFLFKLQKYLKYKTWGYIYVEPIIVYATLYTVYIDFQYNETHIQLKWAFSNFYIKKRNWYRYLL